MDVAAVVGNPIRVAKDLLVEAVLVFYCAVHVELRAEPILTCKLRRGAS